MRAITRDEGHLRGPQRGVPSARRRRVVHSVTTRKLPLKPAALRRRQSSAPLRQPASHSWVQPGEPWRQRADPDPKHLASFAAHDSANHLPTTAGAARDLLDRRPSVRERLNCRMDLFPAQKAFVLKALGRGQKCRLDADGVERLTDRWHRLPHRAEERSAGILHQMPAIGDLDCVGQCLGDRLTVSAAAITRHHTNARCGNRAMIGGA